jgi:hypothetical protein
MRAYCGAFIIYHIVYHLLDYGSAEKARGLFILMQVRAIYTINLDQLQGFLDPSSHSAALLVKTMCVPHPFVVPPLGGPHPAQCQCQRSRKP